MTPQELSYLAAEAACDKKAEDVVVIEVRELLVVTDYFIVATAQNNRQLHAIIDEIEDRLRDEGGIKPLRREGLDDGQWALLDYGDFVVHVFLPEARDFYRLESLWGDAPFVEFTAEDRD